jgi:hypothetical protein
LAWHKTVQLALQALSPPAIFARHDFQLLAHFLLVAQRCLLVADARELSVNPIPFWAISGGRLFF